jgi:hypothetical protein
VMGWISGTASGSISGGTGAVGLGSARMGCGGVTGLSSMRGAGMGLAEGDGGLVGRKSIALGTGPIDSSSLVAQSNHARSCGAGFTAGLAVVVGAGYVVPSSGSCTS